MFVLWTFWWSILGTRRRDARGHRESRRLRKDIIVAGGSAGGVEALSMLVEGLPRDLDAAVLAVIHMPPHSPGRLVEILQRRTALRVSWAHEDGAIEPGHVYVALPDHHLVVEAGRMRLTQTAPEHHNRPAIDPLLRSAALAYGPRAIAVVLSGRLDDGAVGLHTVKELGGTTVVQDPDDALHPDMPRNALAGTTVDHVVPAGELGELLGRLVAESPDEVAPRSV
jgi:two-component system, chemotaxis family, protein-glutamate methylesterase/glutaminase